MVAGATLSAPADGRVGMPGSMATEDAFSTSHEMMAASPELMEDGDTVNVTTDGFFDAEPPISIVIHPENIASRASTGKKTFFIDLPLSQLCKLAYDTRCPASCKLDFGTWYLHTASGWQTQKSYAIMVREYKMKQEIAAKEPISG